MARASALRETVWATVNRQDVLQAPHLAEAGTQAPAAASRRGWDE